MLQYIVLVGGLSVQGCYLTKTPDNADVIVMRPMTTFSEISCSFCQKALTLIAFLYRHRRR